MIDELSKTKITDKHGSELEIIKSGKGWVAFMYFTHHGGYIVQPNLYNPLLPWVKTGSYGPDLKNKTLSQLLKNMGLE